MRIAKKYYDLAIHHQGSLFIAPVSFDERTQKNPTSEGPEFVIPFNLFSFLGDFPPCRKVCCLQVCCASLHRAQKIKDKKTAHRTPVRRVAYPFG